MDLAGLFGFNIGETTTTTTTPAYGIKLSSLISNSGGVNPFEILNLIGSSANSLASITPLLSLLPLDQLFPNSNQQLNLGIISSLPQILNLIQSFNNFRIPSSNVCVLFYPYLF